MWRPYFRSRIVCFSIGRSRYKRTPARTKEGDTWSLMTMHGAHRMPQKPIAQRIKRLRRQESKPFFPLHKSIPRTISPYRIFPHPRLGQLLLQNAISFRCRPPSSSTLHPMDMFIYPHIHIFIFIYLSTCSYINIIRIHRKAPAEVNKIQVR